MNEHEEKARLGILRNLRASESWNLLSERLEEKVKELSESANEL